MGTSGVPLNLPKSAIIKALKEAKGVKSHAAKALDIAPWTLTKKINEDEELIDLLNQLRHNFEETMLDMAENTLMYALSKREDDLGNSLKSTFYILNNKGKDRGYSAENNPNNAKPVTVKVVDYSNKDQETAMPN